MFRLFSFIVVFCFCFVPVGYAQTVRILIETNLGNMEVMLYDDTPNHRNEFLKLVKSGHFDGTLFYRVVDGFLIQGGSSDSRNAPRGKHIGYGRSESTINSEIKKHHVHKRGALCAPRQPEDVNIFKKSDVSQFYIVTGKVYSSGRLDTLELAQNRPIKNRLIKKYYNPRKEELAALKKDDPKAYRALYEEIRTQIDVNYITYDLLEFNEEQRKAYTTVGGVPDLDGDYTVFGELISGFQVLKKIEKLKTDPNDRPYMDVKMCVKVVKEQ